MLIKWVDMSTRSSIALKKEDGTVESIYCHSDGYPSHVGELLQNHYNAKGKVRSLLELGDLSSLGKYIEPQNNMDKCRYDWRVSGKVEHSFDTPHEHVSVAYHRDRGEELNVHQHDSEQDWKGAWMVSCMYIFKDNKWYCDGELLKKVLENESN